MIHLQKWQCWAKATPGTEFLVRSGNGIIAKIRLLSKGQRQ